MMDQLHLPPESVRFPEERLAVAAIQAQRFFHGREALQWGIDSGLVVPGDVLLAEVSPTLRCPEACELCPDSSVQLEDNIRKGLATRDEKRAAPAAIQNEVQLLYSMGVRHFMFIGGTVDHLPELPDLLTRTLHLGTDARVSWFTDMITQIDQQTGEPSVVLKENLQHGWIERVATHVSMDYPYIGDLLGSPLELPPKKGRYAKFILDADYSRQFKSQYGAVGARRLIEAGVRRIIVNITVGPKNIAVVPEIYQQVASLQEYGASIDSPTEVLLTFSPMIWRPHQARGASPVESPTSAGFQMNAMPLVNQVFTEMLEDTYARIADGRPRLLANSSGYTHMMADAGHQQLVVDQDLPYVGGRPEMLDITPTGDIRLDPMFMGPELAVVRSIFGYRDREPRRKRNPFVRFQRAGREWFPNIIST